MDLRTRVAAIVAALPADGSVTLTVATLRGWVDEEGGDPASSDGLLIDLTVDRVAEKLNRAPATVRSWICQRRLPGAYRLRGREWRIPPSKLRDFLHREAEGEPSASRPRPIQAPIRLGDWRSYVGGRASCPSCHTVSRTPHST